MRGERDRLVEGGWRGAWALCLLDLHVDNESIGLTEKIQAERHTLEKSGDMFILWELAKLSLCLKLGD